MTLALGVALPGFAWADVGGDRRSAVGTVTARRRPVAMIMIAAMAQSRRYVRLKVGRVVGWQGYGGPPNPRPLQRIMPAPSHFKPGAIDVFPPDSENN